MNSLEILHMAAHQLRILQDSHWNLVGYWIHRTKRGVLPTKLLYSGRCPTTMIQSTLLSDAAVARSLSNHCNWFPNVLGNGLRDRTLCERYCSTVESKQRTYAFGKSVSVETDTKCTLAYWKLNHMFVLLPLPFWGIRNLELYAVKFCE